MYKTSYFAKIRTMSPENRNKCIGIVRFMPPTLLSTFKNIPDLSPNKETLEMYKLGDIDEQQFSKAYLDKLNRIGVEWIKRNVPEGSILVCYEKSSSFCHRHILAKWLKENGVECEEY